VPRTGVEPVRPLTGKRRILSPLCLPISPSRRPLIVAGSTEPPLGAATGHATPKRAQRNEKREARASLFRIWSGKRDSNSRPQPWQGCALPTELFPHDLLPVSDWRRDPESNRARRICNPLHNRFAIAPNANDRINQSLTTDKKGKPGFPFQYWSGKRDSNSRPQPWQGCALPTELFPHVSDVCQKLEF